MTQKILGHPLLVFLLSPRPSDNSNIPQCESRIRFRPCIGVRRILVSRGFFGQSAQLTRLQPISGVCGKTLCAGTTPAATHIGEEVFIDRNHAGSSRPAQLRVLRKRNSSGKASSDAGPELAGRESCVAMESPQALMCPLEN